MAQVLQNLRLGGIQPKTILLLGLVLFLLVALFFIPEIIEFQSSFSRSSETAVYDQEVEELVATEERDDLPSVQEAATERSVGGIESLTDFIESGYREGLRLPKASDVSKARARVGKEESLGFYPITWEQLRGPTIRKILSKAHSETMTLARSLPLNKISSRYALRNFAAGVGLILERAEKTMTAQEVFNYVEDLDHAVTRALIQEKVERVVLSKWNSISLGPLFEQTHASHAKMAAVRPFNPNLTLTELRVSKPGGRGGSFKEDTPVNIRVTGYVVGKEINNVEVYRNGLFVNRFRPKNPDVTGRRQIRFSAPNGLGTFTLVARDMNGEIYEKSYSFYPKVRMFPWSKGRFWMPDAVSQNPLYIDTLFRVPGSIIRKPKVVNAFFSPAEIGRF